MRSRLLVPALVVALLMAACGGTTTETVRLVSPDSAVEVLQERASEVVLLDVRTPEEFAGGHIAGSMNIDFYAGGFSAQLEALPKDVPYVVYCRSGNRSSQTAELMASLGFEEVFDVDGGIISWNQAGLPVER